MCCRQLDHFLLSSKWMETWPNLAQYGLKKSVSNHAVLLLKEVVANWGAKPFKFVNGWIQEKEFIHFLE